MLLEKKKENSKLVYTTQVSSQFIIRGLYPDRMAHTNSEIMCCPFTLLPPWEISWSRKDF